MSSALLLSLALLTTAAGPRKTTIVIFDVQDQSGANALLAKQLTQVVSGEVARTPGVSAISSSEIRQALGLERQKQLLGCNESACLAEIGSALGADYLLATALGKIGTRYRLDVRLLKGANARIVASAGDFVSGNEDAVADAVVSFTDQVLAAANLPVPPRPAHEQPKATAELGTAAPAPAAAVSHTPSYVLWGAAGALAVGATVMSLNARSTFNDAVANHSDPSSLSWKSPLADGLWAGALVAAGAGTWLYFSAEPSPGGGGFVSVGGSF